jgi:hypothetical protein
MKSPKLEKHLITCQSELKIKPKSPDYFSGLTDELKRRTQTQLTLQSSEYHSLTPDIKMQQNYNAEK